MTVYGQNVATSLEREEVLKKDWVTERHNVQLTENIDNRGANSLGFKQKGR